jgi:hypothetical protein
MPREAEPSCDLSAKATELYNSVRRKNQSLEKVFWRINTDDGEWEPGGTGRQATNS